jgi:dolichyl-phosphate-mannose--protein O-mannosyl transferase
MPDVLVLAGALLVAGPAIGTICLSYPPLWRVWTVPREEHLALVAAHRLAWTVANVGFTAATVLTAAGLVLLAGSVAVDARSKAMLMAGAVAYAIAGTLWCAVVAIRARTTPALADMVAAGTPTEPAETLLGSAIGGLFAAFMLTTAATLVAFGLTLALGGGVAAPVAWLATLIAALTLGRIVTSGDVIPAVVYFPTLLVGLALLLGWS